jgi:hypothetical protein
MCSIVYIGRFILSLFKWIHTWITRVDTDMDDPDTDMDFFYFLKFFFFMNLEIYIFLISFEIFFLGGGITL